MVAEEARTLDLGDVSAVFAEKALFWTKFVDMRPYIDRLGALMERLDVQVIAPTHGLPITDVAETVPKVMDGLLFGSEAPMTAMGTSPTRRPDQEGTSPTEAGPGRIRVQEIERITMRRVYWRLTPVLFAAVLLNYLDRINIGFAALRMNRDLGFTSAVFGFGASIFFVGYMVTEVPSNLMLHRLGARVWIARILLTWGSVATAMALVGGAWASTRCALS